MREEEQTSEQLTERFEKWAVSHAILDRAELNHPVFTPAEGQDEAVAHARGVSDILARLDGQELPKDRAGQVDAYIQETGADARHIREALEPINWAYEQLRGYR